MDQLHNTLATITALSSRCPMPTYSYYTSLVLDVAIPS